MQYGSAAALRIDDSYYAQLTDLYRSKRDRLVAGLRSIGLEVYEPQGTYFVLADHRPFGFADDVSFIQHLITEVGVAAIPPSAFYTSSDEGSRLVRFAFCKDDEIIDEALAKLSAMR
jgi:N-succinyldiaminopimelate aminotransferase